MKTVKRIVVLVAGGTVLAIGVALIVLPGPAFLVIPAGLAILGLEFAWARRALHQARALAEKTFKRKSDCSGRAVRPGPPSAGMGLPEFGPLELSRRSGTERPTT